MKQSVFTLTPPRIMFDQFWIALKKRNLWLIYLRYGALVLLLGLLAADYLIESVEFNSLPIAIVTGCILVYNLILHRTADGIPETIAKFHGLHFALIQISLDFIALLVNIHFTGGIESPFSLFFIFHIIVGSLLLPAGTVSLLITATLLVMFGGAMMEFNGIIPHHVVAGLHATPLYDNTLYMVTFFLVLSLTLFISNYLANSISKELYLRERSLTRAYRKLEEAERQKSQYVMSVVHDLKTPIAAAITYLNMILENAFGKVNEQMERPLERSRLRLNNAITVINDILLLSKLKLTSRLEVMEINMTELLEEIYQEMRILFVSKRIRFSSWTNADHDLKIEADRKLLKLALSNLLSNSYKYTDPEGIVQVHLKEENGSILIELADDGIGIPEAEQSRIFSDFYRSSISKKKSVEGTGLGLSLVLQIIRQLNGRIWIESPSAISKTADRPGTSFFITLPRKHTPAPELFEDEAEGDENAAPAEMMEYLHLQPAPLPIGRSGTDKPATDE